jgi:hypothetical protein
MRGQIADWSIAGNAALIAALTISSLGERYHRSHLATPAA